MDFSLNDILFYVFGTLAVVLSLCVVFMRNPVTSAMMMALSFGAIAAVIIGLGAHFLGILQILVYAGAIMVLFSFIIMLLNVKQETSPFKRPWAIVCALLIAGVFLAQLIGVIYSMPQAEKALPEIKPELALQNFEDGTAIHTQIGNGEFPDTALLGQTLFTHYNLSLVLAGLALSVAAIGVVTLCRKVTDK